MAVTLLAGCGGDDTEPDAEDTSETTSEAPQPDPGTTAPGTEVIVENLEDASHTLTPEAGVRST